MEPFWKTTDIPIGETQHWELGPLSLWVRHTKGEWHVASRLTHDRTDDSRWLLAESSDFPEETDYQRFAFDAPPEETQLTLKPEFPDRSIVSKPLRSLQIPPGASADFFCRVSLCVQLTVGTGKNLKPLTTLPLATLSRTWFGSPLEGEPCYASSTNASRDFRDLEPFPYRVVCPVRIINRSPEPLPFERICIRVRHLKIYQGEDYLWSNEIRITKNTAFEVSQVSYLNSAPSPEPGAIEIAPAQVKVSTGGGILLRTFNNLRNTIETH